MHRRPIVKSLQTQIANIVNHCGSRIMVDSIVPGGYFPFGVMFFNTLV